MKHYPHHIGDFDKATRHLTRIERSVYRDLIDLYYDTERPLTLDTTALCRRVIARTNEEATAVEQVLNEFFTKTPAGWYHDRCEAEIEAYRANTSQRAMAGKASAEAKKRKKAQAVNGRSTPVEQPLNPVATDGNGEATNQEPINQSTNQPKEITVSDKVVGGADAPPAPAKPADTPPAAPPAPTPSPRGSRLPNDWQLPKAWGDWALAEFPHWTAEAVRTEAAKFADHWRAKSGKDATKADWLATWRNWCRSDIAQRAHQPRPGPRVIPPSMSTEDRNAEVRAILGIKDHADPSTPPMEALNA